MKTLFFAIELMIFGPMNTVLTYNFQCNTPAGYAWPVQWVNASDQCDWSPLCLTQTADVALPETHGTLVIPAEKMLNTGQYLLPVFSKGEVFNGYLVRTYSKDRMPVKEETDTYWPGCDLNNFPALKPGRHYNFYMINEAPLYPESSRIKLAVLMPDQSAGPSPWGSVSHNPPFSPHCLSPGVDGYLKRRYNACKYMVSTW